MVSSPCTIRKREVWERLSLYFKGEIMGYKVRFEVTVENEDDYDSLLETLSYTDFFKELTRTPRFRKEDRLRE